jgi:hypothetical protein
VAADESPAATPAEAPGTEPVSAAAGTEDRSPLVAYGVVGLVVAGVLAGGAVLLRRRRRP